MSLKKINDFMEKFWLMVGVVTAIYGIYMVGRLGFAEAKWYIFFPCVAFIFYYTRKRMRKALEKRGNPPDK